MPSSSEGLSRRIWTKWFHDVQSYKSICHEIIHTNTMNRSERCVWIFSFSFSFSFFFSFSFSWNLLDLLQLVVMHHKLRQTWYMTCNVETWLSNVVTWLNMYIREYRFPGRNNVGGEKCTFFSLNPMGDFVGF